MGIWIPVTDPFAIAGFAMVCLLVIILILLLTVVQRRSAQEVWDSVEGRQRSNALDERTGGHHATGEQQVSSDDLTIENHQAAAAATTAANEHATHDNQVAEDNYASEVTTDTDRLIPPSRPESSHSNGSTAPSNHKNKRPAVRISRFVEVFGHHSPKQPDNDQTPKRIDFQAVPQGRMSLNEHRNKEMWLD
ncbi:uncharacterized protein LTR77_001455 [Saxophila tyrrhenica]|uniref:Uncharacterized protein n=1 Tax=Saxophila tyrrhenica TaxID=1690608 RepID=A0AAV9PKV6_9PEZI|nr:hypothetical protein LTR77_001455 [Saxophila tyrrhenica]